MKNVIEVVVAERAHARQSRIGARVRKSFWPGVCSSPLIRARRRSAGSPTSGG